MAKGRKNNTAKNEETSLLKLIKFNQDIIEDNNKTPNVLLDDYVGIVFNECACELVQIKQTTVSEDNIKSTTNLFEDKYKIGDTFQQWITMGWASPFRLPSRRHRAGRRIDRPRRPTAA
jgi:hypothetical protein